MAYEIKYKCRACCYHRKKLNGRKNWQRRSKKRHHDSLSKSRCSCITVMHCLAAALAVFSARGIQLKALSQQCYTCY